MGVDRAADPGAGGDRPAAARPAPDVERGLLGDAQRCPWRDLPERFGPWETAYCHSNTWRQQGVLDRVIEALQIRLDAEGHIDWDLWCVDGSSVRVSKAAAGAGKRGAPASPKTTLWAARAADSGASSTWSLTVTDFPSRSTSRRARSTSARSSKKS
jgi:hypothetical protein